MNKEVNQEIIETITSRGWNIYYRGKPDSKIDFLETYRRGPVNFLEERILYVILPKVSDPTNKLMVGKFIEKHQVQPEITVPSEGPYCSLGRVIYQFEGGGDEIEDCLMPREVYFIGFKLQEKEVKLLAPSVIFMPYDVFLEALKTLQDISDLEKS